MTVPEDGCRRCGDVEHATYECPNYAPPAPRSSTFGPERNAVRRWSTSSGSFRSDGHCRLCSTKHQAGGPCAKLVSAPPDWRPPRRTRP